MGYYAHIRDYDLRITDPKRAANILRNEGLAGDDFIDCICSFGYEDIELDTDGKTVITLIFNGKYRGDDELWRALAPVIDSANGGVPYIEWQGEDNELWRFVFENGRMTEVGCDITWPYEQQVRTVPVVVEPLAITTKLGRERLVSALDLELVGTSNLQRANEIRMTIKSIEDAEKVVLNLEVIQ